MTALGRNKPHPETVLDFGCLSVFLGFFFAPSFQSLASFLSLTLNLNLSLNPTQDDSIYTGAFGKSLGVYTICPCEALVLVKVWQQRQQGQWNVLEVRRCDGFVCDTLNMLAQEWDISISPSVDQMSHPVFEAVSTDRKKANENAQQKMKIKVIGKLAL